MIDKGNPVAAAVLAVAIIVVIVLLLASSWLAGHTVAGWPAYEQRLQVGVEYTTHHCEPASDGESFFATLTDSREPYVPRLYKLGFEPPAQFIWGADGKAIPLDSGRPAVPPASNRPSSESG